MFKKFIATIGIALMSTMAVASEYKVPELKVIGITDLKQMDKKELLVETTTNPTTQVKEKRLVVKNDPGGSLAEFMQSLSYAKNNDIKFKIDGMCASACTLILATQLNLDVCVTPNAVFGIHHPYLVAFDGLSFDISYSVPAVIKADAVWKEIFVKSYPDWINQLIERNGGAPNVYNGNSTSDLFKVDALLIGDRIKKCE